MIVHLVRRPPGFRKTTYRCAKCGLVSDDPYWLCEPIEEKERKD